MTNHTEPEAGAHPAENEASLTIEQASDLVGDDIAYWLNNPFMDRDAIASKVCWWITKARAIPAEGSAS
jgi:hypothetical protein